MLEARPALSSSDLGNFRIQQLLQQLKPFECEGEAVFPPTWSKRARKRRRAREEALGGMPKRGRIVAVDTAREAYTVQFDPDSEEEEEEARGAGGARGAGLDDTGDDSMFADDADSARSDDEEASGVGGDGDGAGAAAAAAAAVLLSGCGGALVRSDSAIAAAVARRTVTSTGVDRPFDFIYPNSWLNDTHFGMSDEEEGLQEAEARDAEYAADGLVRRSSGAPTLLVQRTTLQADALRLLLDHGAAEAIRKDKFRVVFSGEQGEDEGGLTREFLGASLAPLPSDWQKAVALFAYDSRPPLDTTTLGTTTSVGLACKAVPPVALSVPVCAQTEPRVGRRQFNRSRHASDQLSGAEWRRLCAKPLDVLDPRAVKDSRGRFVERGGGFGGVVEARGFTREEYAQYFIYRYILCESY